MIKNLRESKAKLSELVELAGHGEDVLITVRGRAKARLTRAAADRRPADTAAWLRELRALQRVYRRGARRMATGRLLSGIREDRV